jgi:hypothetical protein
MTPTLTPFERAAHNNATLYSNMISAYAVNTQIHMLLQEEESFAKQSGGAPGYYEAASLGLRWSEITSMTKAEA